MLFLPPRTAEMARSTAAIGRPFTLTATDGTTVTDQTYRGKWMLIYFGYTSCPDACPTALNDMGVTIDRLGREAAALQPIFITVDPTRDTREALTEYLKSFDPHIVALTGTKDQIAVAKAYRVYYSAHEADGGNYHPGASALCALEAAVARLDKYHLLILDDLAYVTKDHAETSVLFELIGTRYERRSLLVTANAAGFAVQRERRTEGLGGPFGLLCNLA
jgi:cytochrome oxidase Cu insertion factor (SCO1/SenC/PrrC family)